MTQSDLSRIETTLNVKLPSEYREVVLHYPVRFDYGNADSPLWDAPGPLIRQNEELRTTKTVNGWLGYTHVGWPTHFFFIGGDVELSYVLDLRQSPCRVLEIMHWDVSGYAESHAHARLFKDWLDGYLDDFRKDNIDIASEEHPIKPVPKGCVYAALGFLLIAYIAGGAIWLAKRFGDR
jgi:hypothetical protein